MTFNKALLLIPFALALSASGEPPFLLREQAWTPAGAMLAFDMTHAPAECVAERTPSTEIGRALFRSPALLGGPAARAGLSCHACHSNGRINAQFLLPELTDRPGAADVTSEWASQVRGDGVANPVSIPDLADIAVRTTFGQVRDPSLKHFVHGVIEEEFQGDTPPDQAFTGLLNHLRALRQCPANLAPITLASAAEDVRRALAAAESAEPDTARLVLLAAQDAVGRLVERLPTRAFSRQRGQLAGLARELGALRRSEDIGAAMATALPGWRSRFDAIIDHVEHRERRTYYNEATLRRALER